MIRLFEKEFCGKINMPIVENGKIIIDQDFMYRFKELMLEEKWDSLDLNNDSISEFAVDITESVKDAIIIAISGEINADYDFSTYYSATYDQPAEGGELEVYSEELTIYNIECFDSDGDNIEVEFDVDHYNKYQKVK